MNMSLDTIRAWKDEEYRESLNAEQVAVLGENPAGAVELTDEELDSVEGALSPAISVITITLSVAYSYYFHCYTF